jgi:hypothetical protein
MITEIILAERRKIEVKVISADGGVDQGCIKLPPGSALSRRDIMKIAQRFNAGFCGRNTPQSRRDGRRISRCFFRP